MPMSNKLQTIQSRLRKHKNELTNDYKVQKIGIFGSVARGDDHAKSDVDILVEFSEPVGFFHYLALENFLRNLLKETVEVVTVRALKPAIKEQVLSETVYV